MRTKIQGTSRSEGSGLIKGTGGAIPSGSY